MKEHLAYPNVTTPLKSLLQKSKTINWLIFSYLLIVIGLCLSGNISFGHGSGDVTYIFTLVVSTIIYLVLIRAINRKEDVAKKEVYNLIIAAVFLLIALSITYKFTIGRGSENSWSNNTLAIHTPIISRSVL